MPVISKLILIDPNPALEAALRFGFEREGVSVSSTRFDDFGASEEVELIILAAVPEADHRARIAKVREVAKAVPVLYLGNGVSRQEALEAGATERLAEPAYLRDVITTARVLASPKKNSAGLSGVYAGDLTEHFGLYYLVRAVHALGRSAVLTLVRGLRRGELRFYRGEVTSAQLGMLHGIAALHQLMLWTNARFELRPEAVVRRAQIPLAPGELLEDIERFLAELREISKNLSPSQIYAQEQEAVDALGDDFPEEAKKVLQLFDGVRIVADVVEDSPYRVLETLRLASRLKDLGLLVRASKVEQGQRKQGALPLESWLSGQDESKPVRLPNAPGDWKNILPHGGQTAGDSFSGVVPAASAVGEIESRDPGKEPPAEPSVAVVTDESLNEVEAVASGAVTVPVETPRGEGHRAATSDGVPQTVASSLSGEISVDEPIDDPSADKMPKVVIDEGLGVISDAREAIGRATSAAKLVVPERKADFDEVTSPGKRIPGFGGMPRAAEASPAAVEKPTDAASSQLAEEAKQVAEDASVAADAAAFSDDEEAFFAAGKAVAKKAPPKVEAFDDLDEEYEVPNGFWQRFWSDPNRAPKKKKKD